MSPHPNKEETKVKNWKKAGIAALCVAALLAGCGTQGGKDDGNGGKDDTPMDVTLETLRARSTIRAYCSKSTTP